MIKPKAILQSASKVCVTPLETRQILCILMEIFVALLFVLIFSVHEFECPS